MRPSNHLFVKHSKRSNKNKKCSRFHQWIVGLLLVIGILLCCVNALFFFYALHDDENERTNLWILPDMHTNDNTIHHLQLQPKQGDKERILEILHQAGIHDLGEETIAKLPTWSEIVKMYGSEPRIYGLETCKDYATLIPAHDHAVAPAGAFNSGTNLLAELLIHNCHIPARMEHYGNQNRGIRWQVNWGKHTPPELRTSHKTYSDGKVSNQALLPAVTIRDPYVWLKSMCRHNYATQWFHDDQHCPNLVPNRVDRAAFLNRDYPNDVERPQHATNFTLDSNEIPVRVNYAAITKHHKTLAHMWNDWYRDYWDADFPRLIVRFEDLMFHAKNVTTQVCTCAGGELNRGPFTYITDSAKKGTRQHGSDKTDFVKALIKYGSASERFEGIEKEDVDYAGKVLDPVLMDYFGYKNYGEQHDFEVLEESDNINGVSDERHVAPKDDDFVLARLRDGGVSERILSDPSVRAQLPTWSQITELYGTGPIIEGLDTCERFQNAVPALDRHLGAAGMFNTGTNLITMLLKANCIIPERYEHYGPNATKEQYGMRWQVPWGKHTPANRRLEHHATKAAAIVKEHVLPIVLIRDPYNWMQSMCLHPYTAKWPHAKGYCPHLVHYDNAQEGYIPVHVKFANNYKTHHESLAHLWNDWYDLYFTKADYPRLIIRFEDVIFFQEQVTEQVCACAGGKIRTDRPFSHLVDSAKDGPGHGKESDRTGMVDAWIKYGKPKPVMGGFVEQDYHAAKAALNSDLMQYFRYRHAPVK